MKTKTFTFLLLLGSTSVFAQPWLRTGNIIAPTDYLGTNNNQPLNFRTNNVQRMTVLGTVTTITNPATAITSTYRRSGFVGLNNTAPLFHLDITTPEPDGNNQYGELLLRARTVDDTNAYISFVNLTTTGTVFNPALLGRQSNNTLPALSTVGSIFNGQDVATNLQPVTRFMSGINYDPAIPDLGLGMLNPINNRKIFGWFNGGAELMAMQANGYTGIGTSTPGNRLEINSDFYDAATGLPIIPGSLADTTFSTNNGVLGFGGGNATGLMV